MQSVLDSVAKSLEFVKDESEFVNKVEMQVQVVRAGYAVVIVSAIGGGKFLVRHRAADGWKSVEVEDSGDDVAMEAVAAYDEAQ